MLKQGQYVPVPVERQVLIIFAATRGYVDKLEISQIGAYEKSLGNFIEKQYPGIFESLRTKKTLDDETEKQLKKALDEFASAFGKKA